MLKLSIIIPCFNHFEKMEKCLKSLENQTYKNFEVIFIDDKSTDDLYSKLVNFSQKSNLKIQILQNEKNEGPGFSRNKGIEASNGEYITFCDADDYIENNLVEQIVKKIETVKTDCLIYDYIYEMKSGKQILQKSYLIGQDEGFIKVEDAIFHATGSTWCKVYKLSVIKENNITFPNLKKGEDMVFNKISYSKCEKIYYLNENLYHYVINGESLMNNETNESIMYYKTAMNILKENLLPKFQEEFYSIYIKEYFYSMTLSLVKLHKSNKEIKEHIIECEKYVPNLYNHQIIGNMTKFQKICIKFAKKKYINLLRFVILLKEKVKSNM